MPAALLAGASWDTRDFDQRDNGCVEACGVFDPIRFSSGFNAVEQNKDTLWREVLQLIAHPDFHCPHKPSRVLDIASKYVKRTQVIVNELLKGVSENLGFKSLYLNKELNLDSRFRLLTVNYCPFLLDFDLARGLMPHTDHGVLTLLYENDVSGLEVFHNGKWVVMSGVPNAFLVLNADHLEISIGIEWKESIKSQKQERIEGKWGLRKGDPLSPYLFTLVIEVLTLILRKRVCLSESGCEPSASVIMDSPEEFKLVSGLVLSIPKSTACFCNVLNHVKLAILSIIPFFECTLLDSVLLLPKGIIYYIQQLIRGFLWCNGEYKRGKAKVAWDIICLPKSEGGLGIRSLDVFNIALMTTHVWNIISNKDLLWVKWIHMYKLKGRSFWDVPMKADMSWGWCKLLQLRDIIKPFFWQKIGNGLSTSLWYDHWCIQCPLIRLLTPRDITREGYHLRNKVEDLVLNGSWVWPQSWLLKAPDLGQVPVPKIDASRIDAATWRDEHGMEMVPPKMDDILMFLQPIANNRSAKSVIGRLIFAVAAYYIWLERNARIFKKIKRSPEEIRDIIKVTVRLKLLTLRFKNTSSVKQLLSRWQMPRSFRLY
ncbi:retrotransposon protein, putative, ty1-copia subclass [Tanacetum coccineum]|uniref:Retrotransposon protein, putative, ty1-copia subclass n=1 Tax=Tanacetum coccineum TaxID=301880 RepID=A0ABQ5EKY6_9ASTR